MKYGVYSIRDARTGFLPPTVDQNDSFRYAEFCSCLYAEGKPFVFPH